MPTSCKILIENSRLAKISRYHMAPVYPWPFHDSALEGRSRTPSEVLVIGRDFPGPRCTMHPVAQFNITYAYSIVSQRHRPESERGLCTPGSVPRPTRRTGRTKAGPGSAISSRLLWNFQHRRKPSFQQVAFLDDYAAIYRDLSRHGLPAQLATLASLDEECIGRGTRATDVSPRLVRIAELIFKLITRVTVRGG